MSKAGNKRANISEVAVTDARIKRINGTMRKYQYRDDALIEILHIVQEAYGYVPLNLMAHIARELQVPPSKVYGVATFYHFFSLKPKGEHNCVVCTGTACHVKGCREILAKIREAFGIGPGEVTKDQRLGLQTARCIGCCSMAPVAVMDQTILDKPTPDQVVGLIRKQLENQT